MDERDELLKLIKKSDENVLFKSQLPKGAAPIKFLIRVKNRRMKR